MLSSGEMEIQLNSKQKKLMKDLMSWKFKLYLLGQLPMGFIAGMRVRELNPEKCTTSVPFKWLTKNPFRSMYFAVQSMAAELSTAANCLLAITGSKPSVAFIIVDCKAEFYKKANSRVYFTCNDGLKAYEAVEKCFSTGESQQATFTTEGKMKDGTLVSKFEFTWSFKIRS